MRIGDIYSAEWGRWVVFAITPVLTLHACDRVGAAVAHDDLTYFAEHYKSTGERNERVHGFRIKRDHAVVSAHVVTDLSSQSREDVPGDRTAGATSSDEARNDKGVHPDLGVRDVQFLGGDQPPEQESRSGAAWARVARKRSGVTPCASASTAKTTSATSAGSPEVDYPRASSPSATTPATTATSESAGTACGTDTEIPSATGAPAELATTSARPASTEIHHAVPAQTSREPSRQVDMFASLPALAVGGYLATVMVEVGAQPELPQVAPEPPPAYVAVQAPDDGVIMHRDRDGSVHLRAEPKARGKRAKATAERSPEARRAAVDITLMGESDPGPERIAELRGGSVGQWIAEASVLAAPFLAELEGVSGSLVWVEIEPVVELDDGPALVENVEYPAWWSSIWVRPCDDLPWVVVLPHGPVTILADWSDVVAPDGEVTPLDGATAEPSPILVDVEVREAPPPIIVIKTMTTTFEATAAITETTAAITETITDAVSVVDPATDVEASPYPPYVPKTRSAWLEEFSERAGILQFCGGLARREAEELAWEMIGPEPVDPVAMATR